jgi:Cu(I)/Ag(I) efflux system membrane protein CusA/SilA
VLDEFPSGTTTDDRPPARSLSPETSRLILRRLQAQSHRRWSRFLPELNAELQKRAPVFWTRIISEELIHRSELIDPALATVLQQIIAARYAPPKPHHVEGQEHHGMLGLADLPIIDPHPAFDAIQKELSATLGASIRLDAHDPDSLAGFGGEMDRSLQMPGWTNVWTRPIQNRVDMLATGVNAEVGIRVMGRNLDEVVQTSEEVAKVLRDLPGAADVVADPIRGKGYVRIVPDPARAARAGVSLAEMNDVIETALSGRIVAHEFAGRERVPIRLKLAGDAADDELTLKRLLIPVRWPVDAVSTQASWAAVTLDSIADIRVTEGPATIKSENGWLRNYVRLNVRDRDVLDFVADARRVVAAQVALPPGVFIEWTGQYEHSLQARRRLLILMPIVLASIVLILFITYRDWADAGLMALSVPGALAGGVICQWLLGFPFSIAVGMGYIACFGMAAATGIVMLVYLREAVARSGGLERMSLDDLREAVLNGAVHRLRPKLLTEATTILGLAPILWSTGVGAEVIRPMAAPVLGGLLIADEVIDLLLPILFYRVRVARWQRIHSKSRAEEASTAPFALKEVTS